MHSQQAIAAYQVVLQPLLPLLAREPHYADKLRDWRNHQDVRRYMFSQTLISAGQHQQWLQRLPSRDDLAMYVAFYQQQPLAVASVCSRDGGNLSRSTDLEAAIYRIPELAASLSPILSFAPALALNDWCFQLQPGVKLWARVLADNQSALRFNASLGYQEVERIAASDELPHAHVLQCLDAGSYRQADRIKALLTRTNVQSRPSVGVCKP